MNIKISYAIAIAILIYLIMVETSDWTCSEGPYYCMIKCTGEPATLQGTTPSREDSVSTLLRKISKVGETEGRSVKWRRAMILSIIVVTLISIFILGDLTNFTSKSYCLCILLGFFFTYIVTNFFTFHFDSNVEKNINTSVEYIRNKLKLDKELD